MDMDLVLEEIERKDRGQQVSERAPEPQRPGLAPVGGAAELEVAAAAL